MTVNGARLCLTTLCAIGASAAFAQAPADGQWRGAGGASLSAASGNTRSTALLLSAEAARATAQDKISLGASASYARSKVEGVDTTTANKWAGSGEYALNLSAQLYAFGKLGLESDRLVGLNLRTALAGGLGYKIVDTKETSFSVFGGAAYSTDRYRVDKTVGDETGRHFSRASLYFGEESSHQLSATTGFKQRLEVYPGLSGDKAQLLKFTAGLSVAMSNTLSLTSGLTDSYNSKPPEGTRKNDLGVFTGVNVKFGAV